MVERARYKKNFEKLDVHKLELAPLPEGEDMERVIRSLLSQFTTFQFLKDTGVMNAENEEAMRLANRDVQARASTLMSVLEDLGQRDLVIKILREMSQ